MRNQLMPGYLAWKLADGHIMAGKIIPQHFLDTKRVCLKRVDGTHCNVQCKDTWPATIGNVEDAIAFYSTPGPMATPLAERLATCGR